MFTLSRLAAAVVLTGAAALLALAAPDPSANEDTIKDRAGFIPQRQYQPLPGKVVGVLVADVRKVMGNEGRSGPADAFGFSSGGGSYRWVYVPVADKPLIPSLTLPVGPTGEQKKRFDKLSLANAETVKQWGVPGGNVLVEVEVNGGLGAPPGDGFAATNMKVVEGTRDYPLRVADVLEQLRTRYQAHLKEQQPAIDRALADAQVKALKDRKPTGPRETDEIMHVSWLPQTQTLRVHFRTKITDGAFQTGQGVERDQFPLPPIKGGPGAGPAARPLPVIEGARFGTMYGIEFGAAYEVTPAGKVERTRLLPIEAFQKEIPPPPVIRRPIAPIPLPPGKLPVEKKP